MSEDKKFPLRWLILFLLIPFYGAIYGGCIGGATPGGGSAPGNIGNGQNPDLGPGGGGPGGGGPGGGGFPGGGGGGDDGTDTTAGGPSGQTTDEGVAAPKPEFLLVHVLPPAGYAHNALNDLRRPDDQPDTFADPTDIYSEPKPQAVLKTAGAYDGSYSNWGDPKPTDSSGYLLASYPVFEKKGVCKSFVVPYATFEWKGIAYIAEGCPLTCPKGGKSRPYPVDIQLRTPETPKGRCPLAAVNTNDMVNAQ